MGKSEYGLAEKPKTRSIQVSTTREPLIAKNKKRRAFLLYNNGSDTVYILSSAKLTKDDGIPVPSGGQYENETCYGEFFIVAESGIQDVRIEEDTD